jgi:ribosome-binding factor A
MRFKRSERIQEVILEEISNLIQKGLKDPRISGFITVTGVEVSANLKHAKVFVSVMGSEKEKEASLEGLESAKGYIRSQLGKKLYLKSVPELMFKHDDTAEYATNIQKLLNEIHHGRSS